MPVSFCTLVLGKDKNINVQEILDTCWINWSRYCHLVLPVYIRLYIIRHILAKLSLISSEANGKFVNQGMTRLLWNTKVYYSIYKNSESVTTVNRMYPIHTPNLYP